MSVPVGVTGRPGPSAPTLAAPICANAHVNAPATLSPLTVRAVAMTRSKWKNATDPPACGNAGENGDLARVREFILWSEET